MAQKSRHKNAHELTIINLSKVLHREYPDDDIWMNTAYRHEKRTVPGTTIIPDAMNLTQKIAYEVHWKGKRKENHFASLPDGWRGTNIFIVDIWETSDVYVMTLDNDYVHITSQDWLAMPK